MSLNPRLVGQVFRLQWVWQDDKGNFVLIPD